MTGPLRLMLAGTVALIVPVMLYQLTGGSTWKTGQREMERFAVQAERRGHLIDGFSAAQGVMAWIDHYYFENWRLPQSMEDVRFGLPEPGSSGPTAYAFDAGDATVTLFFDGRAGIEDGEVSFIPAVDEEARKVSWECWSPDYRDIAHVLPMCSYEAVE